MFIFLQTLPTTPLVETELQHAVTERWSHHHLHFTDEETKANKQKQLAQVTWPTCNRFSAVAQVF